MVYAIKVERVVKSFYLEDSIFSRLFSHRKQRVRTVLDNVSFEVPLNSRLILYGENGCGKTTLIKVLSGLQQPTSGNVIIDGKILDGTRESFGVVLGNTQLYGRITGKENLLFYSGSNSIQDDFWQNPVVQALDLKTEWLDSPLDTYSLGMKSRLSVAIAFLRSPSVLFLDEPFEGIQRDVRERVKKAIRHSGITTILCTHELSDIENFATDIMVFESGNIKKMFSEKKSTHKKMIEEFRREII